MPAVGSAAIMDQLRSRLVRGLTAGAIFLKTETQRLISVPAPRVRVKSRSSGIIYYRATTPATPGAPPRKLSGRLRASGAYNVDGRALRARVGFNTKYARRLEATNHKYLTRTLRDKRSQIWAVMSAAMRT